MIEANSGRLVKFTGDGIMAIFDADDNIEQYYGNAVRAAKKYLSKTSVSSMN